MNAADLITLAAARGVDLSRVGGNASNTKGVAARRGRTEFERRQGLEVIETARGRGTRAAVAPIWSHAELGLAAQGVPELPWLAARYSYCDDRTVYWKLWYGLTFWVQRKARQNNWRPMVTGELPRDANGQLIRGTVGEPALYLDRLCLLVLDEQRNEMKQYFVSPAIYAIYMRVEEETWRRILESRFALLKQRYEGWLGKARSMIQELISIDEPLGQERIVRPAGKPDLHSHKARL